MMKSEIRFVSVGMVKPCFFLTRTETMDENLEDLVESIRKYGVLQPILVRKMNGGFELVAGDRRLRAAKKAGYADVPVIVRDLDDETTLILQATENLQRQGLNEGEKKRIVTELATRCKFSVQQIVDCLKKSESWVRLYYPADLKNHVKVEAGMLGGEAKSEAYRKSQQSASTIVAECEYCGVSTSEPKMWETHYLCQQHYAEALCDPARYKRHFNFKDKEDLVEAPLPKPKSLESWGHRLANMSPQHSKMESQVLDWLLKKDVHVEVEKEYCLLKTIPDFVIGEVAVYLDGKEVHNGKQLDRDDELRELLRERYHMKVISLSFSCDSEREIERLGLAILKEVKQ